jgi:hydrogenase expression/formation protein HypE
MGAPDTILLAHGGGGRLTRELEERLFLPAFRNPALESLSDSAVLGELPPGRLAFTTDAYVVDPVEFPGGDLGYLSVCGTVNDLAVAGASPLWLTFALILEEGLDGALLERLVNGAARAAREAGVAIVAGDTKVVPRGKGDRAFAITAGVGVIAPGRDVGDHRIVPGDVLLVSGPVAEHGATIVAARHDLGGDVLRSDCAPLASLAGALLDAGIGVHAMHDPTRGGVATTCNEVAGRSGTRIVLDETAIPVRPEVRTVCEVLGLDPLYVACEGRFLAVVPPGEVDRALALLRARPDGRDAARIGTAKPASAGLVTVRTRIGGVRVVDLLSGEQLPRIC